MLSDASGLHDPQDKVYAFFMATIYAPGPLDFIVTEQYVWGELYFCNLSPIFEWDENGQLSFFTQNGSEIHSLIRFFYLWFCGKYHHSKTRFCAASVICKAPWYRRNTAIYNGINVQPIHIIIQNQCKKF